MAFQFRKQQWRQLAVATGAMIVMAAPGCGIGAGLAAQSKYQPASNKTEVHKAAQAGLTAAGLPSLKSSIALRSEEHTSELQSH